MARLIAPADAAALEARTRSGFRERYGREAAFVATAPGRANLVGEHTDYNDGFVLPFAIARRTAVAVAAREDRVVRVGSATAAGVFEFSLDEAVETGEPRWGDYVRGVVAEWVTLEEASGSRGSPARRSGFDVWIDSDVPVGAGLSSSAALEVALASALELLTGTELDPVAKADLCRRAEHRYAGVPCGIMDQMASALATGDSLLLIDCRDRSWRRIVLPAAEVELVVVDSGLPHDLGEGEFARRVEQCAAAAAHLGVPSLRDATRADIARLERDGHALLHARALHVFEENSRVLGAVSAIQANDWTGLGAILDASHASLRDLYEVSRPEMDELVAELRRAGALGARMTGGGFGGSAVALFPAGAKALRELESSLS